ncbi:hypothetical protein BLOT_000197 [Blomia tropicalis]|nr:hypothetical protein BLOT_000197 [Blomia tropicalis]
MSSLNIRSFDQTLTIFAGGNFNVRQLDHHRTYKRRRCPQSTIFDLPGTDVRQDRQFVSFEIHIDFDIHHDMN